MRGGCASFRVTCNRSLHAFSFRETGGGHLSDCEYPHRSLRLGIPAPELAFHDRNRSPVICVLATAQPRQRLGTTLIHSILPSWHTSDRDASVWRGAVILHVSFSFASAVGEAPASSAKMWCVFLSSLVPSLRTRRDRNSHPWHLRSGPLQNLPIGTRC